LSDIKDDFFFRTSLFDTRFIAGDTSVFKIMETLQRSEILGRDPKGLVKEIGDGVRRRHREFGDSSYLLEPDIKDAIGGLRDYHAVRWILKALSASSPEKSASLSRLDVRDLSDATGVLLEIRYTLHELAGRRTDRLYLDYQEELASKLGMKKTMNETASEILMKSFHRSALVIKSMCASVIHQAEADMGLVKRKSFPCLPCGFRQESGLISFDTNGRDMTRADRIMQAFVCISETGCLLSLDARRSITRSLDVLDPDGLSPSQASDFLRTLAGQYGREALTAMLETSVLERIIPEFASIRGHIRTDPSHTWTTDLHSINTVHELKALEMEIPEVFELVEDRECLSLAALLHDLGKGYGRPHATIGATLSLDISRRLGFDEDRSGTVAFLVHHHLFLVDMALHRDLSEEKTALETARLVRSVKRLAMLYLLSLADSRATGPRAWDAWRKSLLDDLFVKTRRCLERGPLRDPTTMATLDERWERLVQEHSGDGENRKGSRLWVLPQIYVMHTSLDRIRRHMRLASRLRTPRDIELDVVQKADHTEITAITLDRHGLFALLAGILTINRLDILSAKIFTWLDAVAVDTFVVKAPWDGYAQWDRIAYHFHKACCGALDVEGMVRETRPLVTSLRVSHATPSVYLNNEDSDFFTLVEVRAPAHLGTVYCVSRAIASCGLNIHRAFLSCSSGMRTDVYSVVDGSGEKIAGSSTCERATRAVLDALEEL